jgi:hypothetical protein
VSSERPPGGGRYRVDVRVLPFTPSWFWEIVDTWRLTVVDNSLARSRTVYPSSAQARAAGREHLRLVALDHPRAA